MLAGEIEDEKRLRSLKVKPAVKDRFERALRDAEARERRRMSASDLVSDLLDRAEYQDSGDPAAALPAAQRKLLSAFVEILAAKPESAGMTHLRDVIIRGVKGWAEAVEAGAK